ADQYPHRARFHGAGRHARPTRCHQRTPAAHRRRSDRTLGIKV
ncbi:Protein QmcA (possibly involved in integral membrane quality control), partial [Pseudomonas sp. FEN]